MTKSTMSKFSVLAAFAMVFFSRICTATSNPVILATTSQCVSLYDNNMPRNATQTVPTDQLPTASTTTTYSIGLVKTIVLTPAPSVTTADLTSTVYYVTTLTSGSNLTSTIYTRTVTVNDIPVSTTTYTATVNETTLVAATTTVPAFPGYTPLGVQHSLVKARFIPESEEDWAVQDEYWDEKSGFVAQEVMCNRGWHATAVSCYFTVYTADFSATATIRRDIPAQTLTRTRYVERTSATRTVWVSSVSTPIVGDSKPTISTDLTITSSWATYMEATFITSTATVEIYSSTATAYAACATDNTLNELSILQYDDLVHAYPLDQLRVISGKNSSFDVRTPNTTSALDCCGYAATEPNAWFYRYQNGKCDVWVGKNCPVSNGTDVSRPKAELWWSAQFNGDEFWRDDSMVVGNGACGGIDVVQPYWFRD